MPTMDRSTSLRIKGGNLSHGGGGAGRMGGGEGCSPGEETHLVSTSPAPPPRLRWNFKLLLPSPTESLDWRRRPRRPGGNLEGALEGEEVGVGNGGVEGIPGQAGVHV